MGQFDAVFSNDASRRTFLKGVGVLGASGVLAACRKSVDVERGGGAVRRRSVPIEQEPGLLHVHEWAGYDNKHLYPSYLDAGYEQPKFTFLINTEGALAKTAAGFEWDVTHPESGYIQDYLNMGAIQPWDTSLISELLQAEPRPRAGGPARRQAIRDRAGLGLLRAADPLRLCSTRRSTPTRTCSATRRRGKISWFDTPWILQMAAISQGMDPNHSFDMTLDRARRRQELLHRSIRQERLQHLGQLRGHVGRRAAGQRVGDLRMAGRIRRAEGQGGRDVHPARPPERWPGWKGSSFEPDTENYHHAHEFADAWAAADVGEWLIGTWGYGHSNLDIDLANDRPRRRRGLRTG